MTWQANKEEIGGFTLPTEMEDYLFDLRGYIVIKNAVSVSHLKELNDIVDSLSPTEEQETERAKVERKAAVAVGAEFDTERHGFGSPLLGDVMGHEPFQRLIDHSSWITHLNRYIGGENKPAFYGGSCIVRWPGQGSRLHSGGDSRDQETQFRYHNNQFRCGLINMILALNDSGTGGGNTSVVPGSHKSNIRHPEYDNTDPRGPRGWKRKKPTDGTPGGEGGHMDGVEGAVEINLSAGDCLLFVDCLTHGSTKRRLSGARKAVLFRYAPRWMPKLKQMDWMDGLTEAQRKLIAT